MLKTSIVRGFLKPYPVFLKYSARNCQSRSLVQVKDNEVQYPPILDVSSREPILRHERQQYYDQIRSIPTVEEKLFEISANFPSFAKIYFCGSTPNRYSGVPFYFYVTRTHMIRGLPEKFQELNVDKVYDEIKPYLSKAIVSKYSNSWSDTKIPENVDFKASSMSEKIIFDLISVFNKRFAIQNDYLLGAAFDNMPRIASYWWHGDFPYEPFKADEKILREELSAKDMLQRDLLCNNLCFQFQDFPLYTVRVQKPLLPILPHDDPFCKTSVEECNHHPMWAGMPCQDKKVVNVPGVWPGDSCEYPFLSFQTPENLVKFKSSIDHYDSDKIDDAFGAMSSFGWLMSLALYQGFTPYHDITYPLVGQTVLTDGQDWNFFVYQMNTICFHSDVDKKDKRNLCWSSGKMRLFEAIEDGEIKGMNDEVLKVLLKFFLNAPAVPEGVILKPYVGSRDALEYNRANVMSELQELYSNRYNFRSILTEIPMWQRIYKYHPLANPCPWIKLK